MVTKVLKTIEMNLDVIDENLMFQCWSCNSYFMSLTLCTSK